MNLQRFFLGDKNRYLFRTQGGNLPSKTPWEPVPSFYLSPAELTEKIQAEKAEMAALGFTPEQLRPYEMHS